MRFNIIGAGRLGKNIALALNHAPEHQLIAICNRNLHTAVHAATVIGAGRAVSLAHLPAVELTFLTTPDDAVPSVVTQLVNHRTIAPGSIIAHCSGVLSSDVLKPLQNIGCLIASIHPLKAFCMDSLAHDAMMGCDCVVEGDARATALLTTLFTRMGARIMPITPEKKGEYHAAAVIASNYLITLAGCAIALLQDAGLTETDASHVTQRLMASNLANLQQTGNANQALTGPLARGDLSTINKHLQAITNPAINSLYRAAGIATLPFTNLDLEKQRIIKTLLLDLSEANSG